VSTRYSLVVSLDYRADCPVGPAKSLAANEDD